MMEQLLSYAKLSAATYKNKPNIGSDASWACAFAHPIEDGTAVGFQGTDNVPSLLADAYARAHNTGLLGRVHQGIYEAFTSVSDELSLLSPDVVYGHSLGGALAIIYAAHLCTKGKPPREVYAFEPPKISADGNIKAILEAYNVKIVITKNGNDLVPAIPFIFNSWQHPVAVTKIGKATMRFPNVIDHGIDRVIASLELMLKQKEST